MEKSLTQLNALLSKHKTLILVLPWVLYALYLVVWAAPQYESKSQLIVKSSDGGSSFDPSSLLMAAGVSGGLKSHSTRGPGSISERGGSASRADVK